MGNIISYLEKYSNFSLKEMPFNEVDNLVLCALSYCNLENIIPRSDNNFISVKNAADSFYKNKCMANLKQVDQILANMSSGKRFGEARLFNYVNQLDKEKGLQFCAFHILLSDNTIFIAIRGTDDTVIGWHESFCLSYQITPSQLAASEYLKKSIKVKCKYRIGGHSKGGNLAQYAALMCSYQQQRQIINIYSNDGPGILTDFTNPDKYKAISDKIIRIVPEFNIIGAFFEKEQPTLIVKSTKKGIISHDALTWCVQDCHFQTTDSCTLKSRLYSVIFRKFIDSLNFSQRKKLIHHCFHAIKKSNITSMSELNKRLIIKFMFKYGFKRL